MIGLRQNLESLESDSMRGKYPGPLLLKDSDWDEIKILIELLGQITMVVRLLFIFNFNKSLRSFNFYIFLNIPDIQ